MNSDDRRLALTLWAAAGLPLSVAFVQAILALVDANSATLGLTTITGPLFEIEVLYQAAIVFKSSPALVLGLFVLVLAAWVAQGVTLRMRPHRDACFAAAGVASVLFFILSFGVYSPLFASGVPTGQLLVFFSVPVLTSALVVGSAVTNDWAGEVLEEASADVGRLKTELDDERAALETAWSERLGDLSTVEFLAPEGVSEARERRAEATDRFDEIAADVERIEETDDPTAARRSVAELEEAIDSLDAAALVDRVDASLRERLRSAIRTEYGEVRVWSRYDEAYTLVNLPTEFREVPVPGVGDVHVDRLDEVLIDLVDDGTRVETVGEAAGAVEEHLDRVRDHVAEREREVADELERAEESLATVEGQVERLDGEAGERIEQLVVDGRDAELDNVRELRRRVDEVQDALHDCRFDEAADEARELAEAADRLVSGLEFANALSASVDQGSRSLSVPESLDRAFVEAVVSVFDATTDHGIELVGGEIRIDRPQPVPGTDEEPDDDRTGSGGDEPGDSADEAVRDRPPGAVLDEVLYLCRELERAAGDVDGNRVQLDLGRLPEAVSAPPVVRNLAQFAGHNTDVVDDFEVEETEAPGFVEFVAADGVAPTRAVGTLRDRYRDRYE